MKFSLLLLVPLLAVLGASASGEDRVERLEGPGDGAGPAGSRELVYRDDALFEALLYDGAHALLREVFYDSSSRPTRTLDYIRKDERLERVEYTDAAGLRVGARNYRYDREGRLLGVDNEGELGELSTGMIASSATPQASWVAGARTTVIRYDDSGRATVIQTMSDGGVLSVERRVYGENGRVKSVSTEDRASGLATELAYDDQDRLVARTETPAQGPEARTEYRYDDSGRLVEESLRRGGHRSTTTRAYDAAGGLKREETRRDGELVLVVDYIENGRVLSLYDEGQLFVKATYIGGRKVKDDFYANGVLSRSREY